MHCHIFLTVRVWVHPSIYCNRQFSPYKLSSHIRNALVFSTCSIQVVTTLLQVLMPYSASMTGWHNTKPSGERNLFPACKLSKDIITIGFFRWYRTFPMISDISENSAPPPCNKMPPILYACYGPYTQVIRTRSSLHCLLRSYLCTTRAYCIL